MSMLPPPDLPILGFITTRSHRDHGFFGGLLLINTLGRPLEFHCTLPILPSRAQSILYGSSLAGYLCGEQIARALVQKAKSQPGLLFTDTTAVLSVRHLVAIPTLLVEDVSVEDHGPALVRPEANELQLESLQLGERRFAILSEYVSDLPELKDTWKKAGLRIDPKEPFGRISEALMEAHPAARAA